MLRANRLLSSVVLVFLGFVVAPKAIGQLQAEALKRLKAATVYIENYHKEESSSGSGFVIARDADSAVIATNHHVVKPESRYPGHWKLQVYFNSGTPEQFSVEGTWISVHPTDDLALLRVEHANLPEPLMLDQSVEAYETQRAYVAGFPFGQLLGVGGQKPSITITEGSISSVRRGSFGEPALIQLSGGIDPGNSGGPIIDEQGRLIAISVAKINQSSIGFGVPRWKLENLQQQIVRSKKVKLGGGYLACEGEVLLPEGLEGNAALDRHHVIGYRQNADQPLPLDLFASDGWKEIPQHAEPKRCRSSGQGKDPWTRLTAHLPLADIVGSGDTIVVQWRTTLEDGSFLYGRPHAFSEQELRNPRALASNSMSNAGPTQPENAPPSAVDEIVGNSELPVVEERAHQFGARIRRVMRAGGYRYLVVYTSDGKLHCIDMQTEEIVATATGLAIDEIASGRTELVGFNRTERTLTRISLPDLKMVGSGRGLQNRAAVRYAHRGCNSVGPVVAVIQPSGSNKLACVQIQASSGRISRFSIDGERRGQMTASLFDEMPMSDGFRVRNSDDGSAVTMWLAGNSRIGGHLLIKNRSRWKYDRVQPLPGYFVPGPTGELLFTADSVLASDLTELHETPLTLPTTSPDYFLTLGRAVKPSREQAGVYAWSVVSCSEATAYRNVLIDGDITDSSVAMDEDGFLPIDERFQCLPQWNRLVVVPPGESTMLRIIELGEPLPNVESLRPSALEAAVEPEMRQWTAGSGGYKVEAKMLQVKSGYVQLQTKDGRKLAVQIEKLSPADQKYIEAHHQP